MSITLKQLEAFIWVVDLGGFRKAAERLNTTQPNISNRIATLEEALQTTLMDRDAGSVRLTSKGRDLLIHARTVLQSADDLIAAADKDALFEGTLRLGVTEMIVHTWLQDFLRKLRDVFSNLNVELTVDLSVNLEDALQSRTLDLALQNGPFRHQTSGMTDLGQYPLIWVVSPNLNVTPNTLAEYPILTHARDTRLFAEVSANFAKNAKIQLVPSSNLTAVLQMTLQSMGVATLPAAMVKDDLIKNRLIQLNYPWTPEPLHFFARFDADRAAKYVWRAADIAKEIAQSHK